MPNTILVLCNKTRKYIKCIVCFLYHIENPPIIRSCFLGNIQYRALTFRKKWEKHIIWTNIVEGNLKAFTKIKDDCGLGTSIPMFYVLEKFPDMPETVFCFIIVQT